MCRECHTGVSPEATPARLQGRFRESHGENQEVVVSQKPRGESDGRNEGHRVVLNVLEGCEIECKFQED